MGNCPHKKFFIEEKWKEGDEFNCMAYWESKTGLPILPSNISPVPQDLNDLIAYKKGISVREAFELDREGLAASIKMMDDLMGFCAKNNVTSPKHIALWDAKVIKAIFNKLNL